MHHGRRLLVSVSVVATVMASLVVTLAAPQVDAVPRPKASVEVADTAALAPDGQSVTIGITASCARGWQVLEAFVMISQPQTSGTAGIPLSCTGRVQTFAVTVSSLDVAFQPGAAQASAGGNALSRPMKDTSQVRKVGRNGSSSRLSPRTFVRSRTVTRGSSRSFGWSWP